MKENKEKEAGKRIKEKIKESPFGPVEISKRLGVCVDAVLKWQRGVSLPSKKHFPKLVSMLNTTQDYITTGKEPPAIDINYKDRLSDKIKIISMLENENKALRKEIYRLKHRFHSCHRSSDNNGNAAKEKRNIDLIKCQPTKPLA